MNQTEVLELIAAGENSRVEFKRDDIRPEQLASRLSGLLNVSGGHVLLGIEDDGAMSGLTRASQQAETWVMQIARDHLQPSVVPTWNVFQVAEDIAIGVVTVPANAPDKPYKAKQGSSWVTKIRVGTITRDATREEEQRLYQQSGGLRYGVKPVPGTSIEDLDERRLGDYFTRVRGDGDLQMIDVDSWHKLLCNLELAADADDEIYATVDGMLLFGANPGRFLPQCGIRAVCYQGSEPDYAIRSDEDIRGPLVPLCSAEGELVETGVVERALAFVRRHTDVTATLDDGRRVEQRDYPEKAIREIVVNALVHRDYSILGTDVLLSIFDDRLEVESPGALPNTVSVEGMRVGIRYSRNQVLTSVMRDYGYVEGLGMGIRRQVIPAMRAHNGTEPELVESGPRLIVRLRK